jgi:hypothetical protein
VGHEVDRLRARKLSSYDQITFVLAIFVIEKNYHTAITQLR